MNHRHHRNASHKNDNYEIPPMRNTTTTSDNDKTEGIIPSSWERQPSARHRRHHNHNSNNTNGDNNGWAKSTNTKRVWNRRKQQQHYHLHHKRRGVWSWMEEKKQQLCNTRIGSLLQCVLISAGILIVLHAVYDRKKFPTLSPSNAKDVRIQERRLMMEDAVESIWTRRRDRMRKARPPPSPSFALPQLSFQNLFLANSLPKRSELELGVPPPLPESFCGQFASSAALDHPHLYPVESALNSESVVMISGILSPLGFHLAHYLYDTCQVSKIIGIDPMLPNTVYNRLTLLDRMSNLLQSIPVLHFPIYTSFIGIEPRYYKDFDIMTKFHPTHIVHLSSLEGYSGGVMMEVRQSSSALEQILSRAKNYNMTPPPQILYVSPLKEPVISKILEVLALSYFPDTPSVGLRMGRIYGPGVSKPTDGDAPLDTMFVNDAVAAVVAGMQYTPSSTANPPILDVLSGNIFSKFDYKINQPKSALTEQVLHWYPDTDLNEGSEKTLAWKAGYFTPFDVVDYDILPEEVHLPTFHCAAECGGRYCISSPMDDIIPLSREVTQGCDAVLYTSSITHPLDEWSFAPFAGADDTSFTKLQVCNVAFLRDDSPVLRQSFILDFLNATSQDLEDKLYEYNGKLEVDGWTLIWLPQYPDGDTLLKLAPGRFFAKTVHYAMYAEIAFPVKPTTSDVLFLISQMYRKELPQRNAKHKKDGGITEKIPMPPEPERKAVLLVAKSKYGEKIRSFLNMHLAERNATLTPSLLAQREFYERIPSVVNRDEFKSIYEPVHRFKMKHWPRTRWVVHHMHRPEGRMLRCEWLQEHLAWGNDVDELTLAYLLAKKDLERKLARMELDDHERGLVVEHPLVETYTDRKEWIGLLEEEEWKTVRREGVNRPEGERDWEQVQDKDGVQIAARIITDESMLQARRRWVQRLKWQKQEKEKND